MKETMKAFRVNAPLKMELEEVPMPTLNDDELLVKVKAVGNSQFSVSLKLPVWLVVKYARLTVPVLKMPVTVAV